MMKGSFIRKIPSFLLRSSSCRLICDKTGVAVKTEPKPLYKQIEAKIKATGPITIADYMKDVLINPACGYYMNKDVFGKDGDFTTSPEISQLFGEMIAIWFINEWSKLGRPNPIQLIELGPGRGTMIEDILRVFKKLKITNEFSVHLVEVSNTLSNLQAKKLCPNGTRDSEKDALYYKEGVTEDGIKIYWYSSIYNIKNKYFCLVLAHEFFDALPIHKFQKTEHGWREVLIDIDLNVCDSLHKFRYILSREPTPATKVFISDSETRDHIEVCPEAILYMQHLARRLKMYGGIGLIVDYGHCGTKMDTFRAFRNHTQCDPLIEPGMADLTADVDFSTLIKAVENELVVFGPITQREFLTNMQIAVRLQVLLTTCQDEKHKETLISGFKMLTEEHQMGSLFKFMCFLPGILKEHFKNYPVYGFSQSTC